MTLILYIDVDECRFPYLNTCNKDTSKCFDLPGDYECQCKRGYVRPPDSEDNKECIGDSLDFCISETVCDLTYIQQILTSAKLLQQICVT